MRDTLLLVQLLSNEKKVKYASKLYRIMSFALIYPPLSDFYMPSAVFHLGVTFMTYDLLIETKLRYLFSLSYSKGGK